MCTAKKGKGKQNRFYGRIGYVGTHRVRKRRRDRVEAEKVERDSWNGELLEV